jgi:hypothetical protein
MKSLTGQLLLNHVDDILQTAYKLTQDGIYKFVRFDFSSETTLHSSFPRDLGERIQTANTRGMRGREGS